MVQLTRDYKKIRKQVSRRRTHVPEWMSAAGLLFFVVGAVFLCGMYINATFLSDDDQDEAVTDPDGGIGGSVAGPEDDSSVAGPAEDPAGDVPATTLPGSAGDGTQPADGPFWSEQPASTTEPETAWAETVLCGGSQATSRVPQAAYDTAEQSVQALFTGDYTTLVVRDDAVVPDITQPGFVIYENPLIQPGCLEATGDVSYVLLFVVDPDRDGDATARTIRTIVEHNADGARWIGY